MRILAHSLRSLAVAICLACLAALAPVRADAQAAAQGKFYLHDGDRVVFYGDSITDQRLYTTFIESYVVTRFPHLDVRFIHSGWGGDRVSGGGGGPIDLRLTRDVIAYSPTVMTIMLGMNDAGYRPYDEALFKTYADGYRHILETVHTALPGIRMTLIQPSPYDDVTRPPMFEGGYNSVLIRYGAFVKQLAEEDHCAVVDMNAPVVAMLEKAKAADAKLAERIIPDRIHPGPGGHLVMAEALLLGWNAPALVSAVEIDAGAKRVARADNIDVSDLGSGTSLTWTQADRALPMPLNPKDSLVALVLKSSNFVEALDQETLKVSGLTAARYELKIDGAPVGTFTRQELQQGINLATLDTPMLGQANAVHELTLKHNNLHFARWRDVQVPLADNPLPDKAQTMNDLDQLEDEVIAQQRATAIPRTHHYELTPQ